MSLDAYDTSSKHISLISDWHHPAGLLSQLIEHQNCMCVCVNKHHISIVSIIHSNVNIDESMAFGVRHNVPVCCLLFFWSMDSD